MRVLIVEDNLLAREMLKEMLDLLGHQAVGEAEDLAGTLAAYEAHKPDLVTVDLSLPKEDGLTIVRELRKAHPEAKAVIVSGNCQERIKEEALKAGALDLLAKPIDVAGLRLCLEWITSHGNNPPGTEGHPPAR